MFEKKKLITDFELFSLNETTMRASYVYEIVRKGELAEVSLYDIMYINEEDKKQLRNRTVCTAAEIIGMLNSCGVLSWNGFVGNHPRGVSDGKMFRLSAVVNGGLTVSANGSENFPPHYRELIDSLYMILNRNEDRNNG